MGPHVLAYGEPPMSMEERRYASSVRKARPPAATPGPERQARQFSPASFSDVERSTRGDS